ncbi:HdeD family acid-resistance protein [Kovacikia minuta CCNUW1]|uniref:HdeD family acid-resistance protein n=1 Tax=Kovacikia minuta TaxID=2931930 RepID=UPI001CCA3646|nr:HdeD family acid-resistance protein [Kovacikia minuta]UBF23672.1 HdeD family acid-resistance protein [Kovacikia minuta CCNUW1]
MTTGVNNDLKQGLNGSIAIGAVLILLGIAAIAFPVFSTYAAEIWISWIILFAGISKIVYAFQTRNEDGFIWKLLLGILYTATGFFLLFYPLEGILTLTLALGIFLLVEGVFEIILAWQTRPQRGWGISLANGITTLLLGGLIWFEWPINGPFAIGLLVGISLIFTGFARLSLSLATRSALGKSS